ncbi:MAG: preprotein translocase subunit SecA [Clostridia bacterium]|nr:preprotein translocase subunit SecA [Clostridia bacterium]
MGLFSKLFGNYSEKELKKIMPLKDKVLDLETETAALSDEKLRAKTYEFKERLKNGETLDGILPEAFAVCREASWRVLGMKHFPVQILGGIVLHQGRISEMKTGEGKTLVATLPAYLNALTGKGVHIVTVNDYLARRDSEWMGKLYRFLGLSVGLVVPGLQFPDKKAAYEADITYCTNNELGFDYLRDNMAVYKQDRMQRGHNFAIVDEVDSILIDEARTPLIISGQGEKSTDLYERANVLARKLKMVKVVETNSKQTDEEQQFDGDYVVDEKAKTCTLTPQGVKKAEEFFGIDNLHDPENMTISHHVNQAIKAHGIMHRDINYVVKDGNVIIVDEFTGRLMYGRRYNEGLHQAIEAKEGVTVAHESKTLASVTFQNFFRLYSKLSGMTGTALTEEQEFREIYNLDVIEIPTNKPLAREDKNDIIYKSEQAKFEAVIDKIIECNKKGQPVLVGTVTIEKSELLSSMLKKRGIAHNVLNAKHHEKEAEIIAQAGKLGAVTIATNMAGRGTDIMLGGNAEYLAKAELRKKELTEDAIAEITGYAVSHDPEILENRAFYNECIKKFSAEIAPEAEKVRAAGGLCIIGTERHESRRIDNQLRGRAGRQGDPGSSQFFISIDDDIMRVFGGDSLKRAMQMTKIVEDGPVDFAIFSNVMERAQKAVESNHFAARRSVLDFDDVINKQRELIYAQRNKVLDGEDITRNIFSMIDSTIDNAVNLYLADEVVHDDWNVEGLKKYTFGWLTEQNDLTFTTEQLGNTSREEIADFLKEKARARYEMLKNRFGEDKVHEAERYILLRNVDIHWMDHIDAMDELRRGIGLRQYGQHDPVVAYRNESFDMFTAMTDDIREKTAIATLAGGVLLQQESLTRQKVGKETSAGEKTNTTVRGKGVVSKNAPCPCGSGKKYKRCCGKDID